MASGESDLRRLMAGMQPDLSDEEYAFCTVGEDELRMLDLPTICTFRENEGVTVILLADEAKRRGYTAAFLSRMITLQIHSSLEAVGFLARVTGRLAEAGISVNAVSAYYHDHLFVPRDRADEALSILKQLAEVG